MSCLPDRGASPGVPSVHPRTAQLCPVEAALTAPWELAEGIEDVGWRLFFQVMNLNGY